METAFLIRFIQLEFLTKFLHLAEEKMIIVPSIKITGFGTLLLFVLFASIYLPSKLNETTNLKKK